MMSDIKKIKQVLPEVTKEDIADINNELNTNPKYSLEADPTGALGMSQEQKEFIKWFTENRNIPVAAELAGINYQDAISIYKKMSTQSELRRINIAMQTRQLMTKVMDVDQVGAMLSSYVLDIVPECERLGSKDKLKALDMLIELNQLKSQMVNDPKKAEAIDVESEVKDLSVDSIKALLKQSKENDEISAKKEQMIDKIDSDSALSNDDLHYLRSLSVKQLSDLMSDQTTALKNAKSKKQDVADVTDKKKGSETK